MVNVDITRGKQSVQAQVQRHSSHSAAQSFTAPAPTPAVGAKLGCEPCSATRLKLVWAPFERLPGVACVEYVVHAEPIFGDEADQDKKCELEGSGMVERVFTMVHTPRLRLEEITRSKEARHVLQDQREAPLLARLLEVVSTEQGHERERERTDQNLVRFELTGLLPCTRYTVTVSARYAGAAAVALPREKVAVLTTRIETLGGDAAPAAPFTSKSTSH